jgi:hypothetical protein
MSETPTAPATDAPAQDAPDTPAKPETDWKAEAKKWESRAKENTSAAKRLAEIEEASKTEAQKTADRLAAAEKEAADARREALKLRIASRFAIGDEDADLFLTGSDEETLTKQAERLSAREVDRKKQGNHVPREGSTPSATDDGKRAVARELFGST